MRASRLLAILILLQVRRRVNAAELAREFEVSERTIYRDVDALSAAGVPIYGERGPGGGFQLLDNYRTRLTGLDPDEAAAFPVSTMADVAAVLGMTAAASRARNKLLAALPAASLAGVGRMSERFHLDLADWYRAEVPAPHLPAITRALLDCRLIEMRYESWKGERDWTVAPLGVVVKSGSWYLVGSARGRTTTFRVAAIRRCRVTDKPFERPPGFDLPAYWRESLARFERDLRPLTATLSATPRGLTWLAELGAFAEQAVAAAGRPDASGCATLTLPIESDAQGARLLIGLADEVTVLGPPSLLAELRRLAGMAATLERRIPAT